MKKSKEEFRIAQRRNGRWMVTKKGGKPVNGNEKTNALIAAGKLKPAAKKAAAADESAAGESAEA